MALFENKSHYVKSIETLVSWRPDQDNHLKALIKEGKSLYDIAKALRKKPFAIIMRMRYISGYEKEDSIWTMSGNYKDSVHEEMGFKWTDEDNLTFLNKYKNGENLSNLSKFYHRTFRAVLLHIQELYDSPREMEDLFNFTKQFVGRKRIVNKENLEQTQPATIDSIKLKNELEIKEKSQQVETVKPKLVEEKLPLKVDKPVNEDDKESLSQELRSTRWALCQEEGVRAYYICNDAVLHELVDKRPLTADELLKIRGFGEYKVKKYGSHFLEVISKYKKNSTPPTMEIKRESKPLILVEHPVFENFGDYLFYSYANLNALSYAEKEGLMEMNKTFLNIRDKSYKSYLDGVWHINDLKKENREKKKMLGRCCFCGRELDETERVMSHVIPKLKEGKESLDNLLSACPDCNESKGNLDLFEWFFTKLHKWPDLWTTVHYMKQVYLYAEKHNLLDMNRTNLMHQDLPFKLEYLPFAWPPPVVWFKDVDYEKYPYEKYVDLNW